MRPFIRTSGLDRQTQVFEDSVNNVFQSLINNVLLNDNKLITGVILTTSDTTVSHGLGRIPKGYIVVDRNANATVYTSLTVNNNTLANYILKASSTVTVNILFF